MIVYSSVLLLMIFITLINSNLKYNKNKIHKFCGLMFVLLLVLVAGLRYNTGTDYYSYYTGYHYFKNATINLLDEPGIMVVAKISSLIYDDPATMMFIAAAITVTLMVSTILKNTKLYWLSMFLYIFLGSWHGCFNGVRQYLAAAILFSGHRYIIDNKFWKWSIVVGVASMFHISAVITILFYFYPKLKVNSKNLIISLILMVVLMYLYDHIFGFIEILKNDAFDFEGMGSGYLTNSINPLRIAVAWVPTIFFRVYKKYYNIQDKEFKFYSNMSLLHAVLMTASINSTYLGRVGIYTGLYISLFWPLLINKIDKKDRLVFIIVLLFFYMIYWFTEISGPTLINFKWIFQR